MSKFCTVWGNRCSSAYCARCIFLNMIITKHAGYRVLSRASYYAIIVLVYKSSRSCCFHHFVMWFIILRPALWSLPPSIAVQDLSITKKPGRFHSPIYYIHERKRSKRNNSSQPADSLNVLICICRFHSLQFRQHFRTGPESVIVVFLATSSELRRKTRHLLS